MRHETNNNDQRYRIHVRPIIASYLALSQSLDDIVEVGSGSLTIQGLVFNIHTHLLRKDVLLDVVVLVGHAAHRPLVSQLSRLLATHLPLHI